MKYPQVTSTASKWSILFILGITLTYKEKLDFNWHSRKRSKRSNPFKAECLKNQYRSGENFSLKPHLQLLSTYFSTAANLNDSKKISKRIFYKGNLSNISRTITESMTPFFLWKKHNIKLFTLSYRFFLCTTSISLILLEISYFER